jgi:hypothetical protein
MSKPTNSCDGLRLSIGGKSAEVAMSSLLSAARQIKGVSDIDKTIANPTLGPYFFIVDPPAIAFYPQIPFQCWVQDKITGFTKYG